MVRNLKVTRLFLSSIGYQVCGMQTSSMYKPVSSGIRNEMGKSILKSESEAESDDLKRLSM